MLTFKVLLENTGANPNSLSKAVELMIPAASGLLGALLGVVFTYLFNIKSLKAKRNEMEISDIKAALNDLYYPILLLIRKNKQLYDIFKAPRPSEFRTLPSLLDDQPFEGNDAVILDSIIDLDKNINDLILQNRSKAKNNEIAELLSKASTHFDIIIKAYEHAIKGESHRFSNYVYPLELQDRIEQEIIKLQARLRILEK